MVTRSYMVEADIDLDELIAELDDDSLASMGVKRIDPRQGEWHVTGIFRAVQEFHDAEHSAATIEGCREAPCIDIDYDGAQAIKTVS